MIEVFYLDRRIVRAAFSPALIKTLRRTGKKVWIDMINPTEKEVDGIKRLFSLHPITAEDMLTVNTRAKIEEFDEYIFFVLYGVYKQRNIRLRELDFIMGKNFLVSAHKMEIDSFEKLKKNKKRLEELFKSGMDFVMHRLIDEEVDNFIPVLELFDDVIDKIEQDIIRSPDPHLLGKILDLKRRMSKIKKVIIPQQEKISFLAKNKYKLISPNCQTYFRDVHDHFYTVTDMIEDYRDALSSSFDAYMSSVSNKMNEVMKMLSIMATIMLPLGVMSGVYGMNFMFLPGAKSPEGFWVMIGAMMVLVVVMVTYFKKKGWV